MKNNIILGIKGFVMGIANIIPGVSGGTLALTLGIYEKFISCISHFFNNIKENIKFLLPIIIGMGLAILSMSSLITKCFNEVPIPTITFFMGLVIGGIPFLFKKIKNKKEVKQIPSYVIALITFSIVIILAFGEQIFGSGLGNVNLKDANLLTYILLILVGIVASATMVIPGVSGSLVLMLLGYYLPVLNTIKSLIKFENILGNILILGFFGLGVLIGIVLVSKLIEFLFSKYEGKTYFGVLGFIIASVVAIPVSVYNELGGFSFNIPGILMGILTLIIGLIIGYKLGEK